MGSHRLASAFDQFLSQKRPEWLLSSVVALFVYGGFAFLPGLHIDDEVSAIYQNTVTGNIGLGRWGTSLFRELLIPQPFNGYFTSLFSISMLVITGVVFTGYLFSNLLARRVALVLFVAFPQFCYQLEFHVQADVIPIAYLAAVMSFVFSYDRCLLRTRSPAFLTGAVSCALFAMSVYQPIVLFTISMGLCVSIDVALTKRSIDLAFRSLLSTACIVMVALPIYLLISSLLMGVPGVVDGRSYFSNQFAWSRQPLTTTLSNILTTLAGSFSSHTYYGENLYGLAVVPVIGTIVLATRTGWRITLFVTPLILALAFLPYSIVVLMGSDQLARTFIVQGACLSSLWGLALTLVPWLASRMTLISAGALIYTLVASFDSSRLAFVDFIQWRSNASIGARVIQDIYHADPSFDEASQSVFFYGPYRQPNFWRASNYDMFGRSFFAWDNGSPDRIATFLTMSGIANIHAPPGSSRPPLVLEASKMPIWPRPGSIRSAGDTIIVRLGQ